MTSADLSERGDPSSWHPLHENARRPQRRNDTTSNVNAGSQPDVARYPWAETGPAARRPVRAPPGQSSLAGPGRTSVTEDGGTMGAVARCVVPRNSSHRIWGDPRAPTVRRNGVGGPRKQSPRWLTGRGDENSPYFFPFLPFLALAISVLLPAGDRGYFRYSRPDISSGSRSPTRENTVSHGAPRSARVPGADSVEQFWARTSTDRSRAFEYRLPLRGVRAWRSTRWPRSQTRRSFTRSLASWTGSTSSSTARSLSGRARSDRRRSLLRCGRLEGSVPPSGRDGF